MSEFQYFEFRTIDNPLSEKDRKEIDRWSSRTTPTSNSAVFTYSYNDFRKDEKKVVEKYFDAMFYFANWGSKRLIFKFPKGLVDIEQIRQYTFNFEEQLILHQTEKYVMIDFHFQEKGDMRVFDIEGCLSSLISLRNDILNGDYRCLYLAWLYGISTFEDWDDHDNGFPEPIVPAGLQNPNGALKSFVELIEIDEDFLTVAIENSKKIISKQDIKIESFIEKLSEKEKTDFLIRMLNGESLLDIKLTNRLKDFSEIDEVENSDFKSRKIGEIMHKVSVIKQEKKEKERRKQEAIHRKKMQNLEQQEDYLWRTIYQKISERKPKSYDETIEILTNLKELAVYKNEYEEFHQKFEQIRSENKNKPSFQRRLSITSLIKNNKAKFRNF